MSMLTRKKTKFILTGTGLSRTYSTTPNTVYEGVIRPSGLVDFLNDNGNRQSLSSDEAYIVIPENGFIGCFGSTIDRQHSEISATDITTGKPYVFTVGTACSSLTFKDDVDDVRAPQPRGVTVLADPYHKAPSACKYEPKGPVGCPCGPTGAKGTVGVSDKGLVGRNPVPKIRVEEPDKETKQRIKKQKAIAAEILEWASIIDGAAFIAGGAPRNWEFNRVAKDLDVFVRFPKGYTEDHCRRAMDKFGITNVVNMATHNTDGTRKQRSERNMVNTQNRTSNILYVFEGQYQGEQVQFIFRENDDLSSETYIHRYFDTSINMIYMWIGSEGKVRTFPLREFRDTLDTGIIFVQEGRGSYSSDHLERVASYFPDQPLCHMDERAHLVKHPEEAWDYHRDWEDFDTGSDNSF